MSMNRCMNLCGTQTGRPGRVKKNDRPVANLVRGLSLLLVLGSLGACAYSAGGWRQASKNEAMTRADYAICKDSAEEATLSLRRSERPGFGTTGTERPGTFNPRGDDTLAIADRSDATTLYDALVESCMVRKGYSQAGTP